MKFNQCMNYIRSDYYRVYGRKNDSFLRMYYATFFNTGLHFLFWFRLAKCQNSFIGGLARLICFHLRRKYMIDIQRDANIGYGLRLPHGGPVVINGSGSIGDNVDIYQYTTIGSMYNKAAHIGNEVYIGPSVCIIEDIQIGDGVTIGAGAVVTKDVMEGATIAGNPARIISKKKPGRLVWRKWNSEWNINNNYK